MKIAICGAFSIMLMGASVGQDAEVEADGTATIEAEVQPTDVTTDAIEDDLESPQEQEKWSEAYDDSFIAIPYWTGEYPSGFQTGDTPVTVKGRLAMSPASPTSVSCTLPARANFHTWNNDRVSSDSLVFWSVIRPTTITITQDAETWGIDRVSGEEETLSFSEGDELLYKNYLAEGFFIAVFNGREYEMSEGEMYDFANFEVSTVADDEWVQVNCDEGFGRRAWLRLSEVLEVEGIQQSEITGFGEASDPE